MKSASKNNHVDNQEEALRKKKGHWAPDYRRGVYVFFWPLFFGIWEIP